MKNHPCQSCGACCSSFRASFHWSETLAESFAVPVELTEQVSLHLSAMRGTDQKEPLCISFEGVVGVTSNCQIYANRPSCCRNFNPSYADGIPNERCDQARRGKGLSILSMASW